MRSFKKLLVVFGLLFVTSVHSVDDNITRTLWASHAIINIYHYNHDTYLADQKHIARYFSASAWINYTKAINAAQLPELIKKNQWQVRSVPIKPPVLKALPENHWQADMPVLVQYKNPQREQYQTVNVSIQFGPAKKGTGIEGWTIDSFQANILQQPCQCAVQQAKINIQ